MTHKKKKYTLFESKIIRRALIDSLVKLNPKNQFRNPVMFVVEVGSILTTLLFVHALSCRASPRGLFSHLALALVHGALRQFCRIRGRRQGQGPGRRFGAPARTPSAKKLSKPDQRQRTRCPFAD